MTLNDELANDRTFLAWLRTGIALFALGFVVSKVAYLITAEEHFSNRDFYTVVGVLIVLSGAAVVVTGLWQHRAVMKSIARDGSEVGHPRWPLAITVVSVGGALILAVLILVSS